MATKPADIGKMKDMAAKHNEATHSENPAPSIAKVGQDTYDLDGWVEVTCVIDTLLVQAPGMKVASTVTDFDGLYGEPLSYTEWFITDQNDQDLPVLRSFYWSNRGESGECRHYVPRRAKIGDTE